MSRVWISAIIATNRGRREGGIRLHEPKTDEVDPEVTGGRPQR
jgi:hypothetical protein